MAGPYVYLSRKATRNSTVMRTGDAMHWCYFYSRWGSLGSRHCSSCYWSNKVLAMVECSLIHELSFRDEAHKTQHKLPLFIPHIPPSKNYNIQINGICAAANNVCVFVVAGAFELCDERWLTGFLDWVGYITWLRSSR